MKVTRLCDALGAEVTGIDLSASADDALVEAITHALLENQVLVIRDQSHKISQVN